MPYAVNEIFYTLQGEGANTGRPAVFCRFAGCNLWTGREQDRAHATCTFCDTDFVGTDGPGGGKFTTADALAEAVAAAWPAEPTEGGSSGSGVPPEDCVLVRRWDPGVAARSSEAGSSSRFVVCTGGEPLLQLDEPLLTALHARGFEVAVETNGTVAPPDGIDWLCVSPKAGAPLAVGGGDELKLVYPQAGAEPERFERLHFRHFFLQPMDSPAREANTEAALRYCLAHPRWRLSLQTHKILGIP